MNIMHVLHAYKKLHIYAALNSCIFALLCTFTLPVQYKHSLQALCVSLFKTTENWIQIPCMLVLVLVPIKLILILQYTVCNACTVYPNYLKYQHQLDMEPSTGQAIKCPPPWKYSESERAVSPALLKTHRYIRTTQGNMLHFHTLCQCQRHNICPRRMKYLIQWACEHAYTELPMSE